MLQNYQSAKSLRHVVPLLLCALCILCQGADIPGVTMTRNFAANLVKNGAFSAVDANNQPQNWKFANYSKSPDFRYSVAQWEGRNCIQIDSPGQKYGYYTQPVMVTEGVRYYVGAKIRTRGTNALIWLKCQEYHDGGSAMGHYPPSKTNIFLRANPEHGADMKKILDDFIPPECVAGVSADSWTGYYIEITPPTGKGVKSYMMQLGAFGGNLGFVAYTDAVFAPAESTLDIAIAAAGWKEYQVVGTNGERHKGTLNPDLTNQKVQLKLSSRLAKYQLELVNASNKRFVMEVPNE